MQTIVILMIAIAKLDSKSGTELRHTLDVVLIHLYNIHARFLLLNKIYIRRRVLSMLVLVLLLILMPIYPRREYVLVANPEFTPLFTTIVAPRY